MAAQPIPVSLNDSLPASVQTEVTVLGAMLLDAVAIVDATEKLRPEDFLLDSHQRIYRAILELQNVGHAVDTITVMEALSRRKELDAIGGPAYLAFLTEGIPRHPNIESYVRIIKDKSLLRQLLSIFNEGMAAAADQAEDATTVLNNVESKLADVADSAIQRGLSNIPEIVANSFGSIDALYEQGREITGLATHYIEFDKMTSGLQTGELIIIAARPSMGKTAWAINIAQNCAVRDHKVVAVFSLEMSKESLLRRMLASEAMVGSRKLQTGFIPREDRGKLISALDRLMGSKMYIDDTPGITLAEMRAKARRLQQQEGGLDLVVIDYLQLMTESAGTSQKKFENRTQEVSSISRGLKALAKELRVPVVALSQLSRGSEQRTGDKKPLLSDLRESGSIEQDADVVAFIHREEYYDRENEDLKGKAEIIIAKQRNGPTGSINLAYIADFTRFENLDTMHGEIGGDAYSSDVAAPSYLLGPEECEKFLAAFEDGSLPAAEWTHQAHIAMATVYLTRYRSSVLPHTRAAIRNYLLARGRPIGAYHETLTIFWLALVAEAMQQQKHIPLHEGVRRNCATFGAQSKLHEQYYGFDVFNSPEAHARWIPPDLRPLTIPFPADI